MFSLSVLARPEAPELTLDELQKIRGSCMPILQNFKTYDARRFFEYDTLKHSEPFVLAAGAEEDFGTGDAEAIETIVRLVEKGGVDTGIAKPEKATLEDAVVALNKYHAAVYPRHRAKFSALKNDPRIKKLREGDQELIANLPDPLPVVGPETPDGADIAFAQIHAAFPWFSEVSKYLWRHVRAQLSAGEMPILPPVLLHGPAGTGKSSYARCVSSVFGAPFVEIDASSGAAGFRVSGCEAGWASAYPGMPLSAVLRERVANPVVSVNDVDRIGDGLTSTRGTRTSMSDALLPLLERGSASAWACPYFGLQFNMSAVTWILTANTIAGLDEALLSRLRVFHAPRPSRDQIVDIVRRNVEDLDEDDAAMIVRVVMSRVRGSTSLRHVRRMVDEARSIVTRPRVM